jgi:ribonuclease R
MLPEELSAGLCSLRQGEPRLTKTATLHYDAEGVRGRYGVERSFIRSAARLTYDQARRALEGKRVKAIDGKTLAMLEDARELHEKLRDRRRRDGAFCFSLPETRVAIGEDGKVEAITREEQDFAHSIIEEFMLEANRAVAELTAERALPAIYRVHEEPDPDDLREFATIARAFGVILKPPYTRQKLAATVESAREAGQGEAVAIGLLRAMKLAIYHEQVLPHYGLAFDRYLHFTSPIRRYPDLWVHRLLDALFEPGKPGIARRKRGSPSSGATISKLRDEVAHVAEHCSLRERAAEAAERTLTRFRQMEFLRDRAEGVKHGMVRDVDERGLVIQLEDFWLTTRAPLERLPPDRYRYDRRSGKLAGKKRSFSVGDRVAMTVTNVDLVAGDVIVEVLARPASEG